MYFGAVGLTRGAFLTLFCRPCVMNWMFIHKLIGWRKFSAMMTQKNMKKSVEEKQLEVKEGEPKKLKPGAHKKQTQEEVLSALEAKRQAKELAKESQEKARETKYCQIRYVGSKVGAGTGWNSYIDEEERAQAMRDDARAWTARYWLNPAAESLKVERVTPEEIEANKLAWRAEHERRKKEAKKREDKQCSETKISKKKFLALVNLVTWYSKESELDVVLDQIHIGSSLHRLQVESPLWHRAFVRGLLNGCFDLREY